MEGTFQKINNVCLVILTLIALTGALVYTKAILIPFVISLFLYAISSPSILWLEKKFHFPRMVCALITIILFLCVMSIVVLFVVYSLKNFIAGADLYTQKLATFFEDVTVLLKTYGIHIDSSNIREEILSLPIFTYLKRFTGSIVSLVGNSTLILIITSFLIVGEGATKGENALFKEIHYKISRYVMTKFTTSFITALLVGILLGLFKVDLAFMFAILTFLFNFIPNVGSIIATALPLPVILLQFGFGLPFIAISLGSLVIQFTIGNVIEPKVMGESMDLHPVAVLLFLMFWGLVWGLPGMFMAVPITAILKIVLSRIETTRPLSELLAGRISNF
ncbi:AI-2E family transporter [Halobacteriovorax sp. GB3]|uniref:AI-2E family transporter n=1 Tax=Halobacteriovorax sp. GB3 TaxID=2719615 RepID=UPI00235F3AAC|nr:AI-2E family transporter [Halobacteriovorax sp. GB3]MDD0851911.1 AI-2E family transporter [Halobacteriovorax sp. GB3]